MTELESRLLSKVHDLDHKLQVTECMLETLREEIEHTTNIVISALDRPEPKIAVALWHTELLMETA